MFSLTVVTAVIVAALSFSTVVAQPRDNEPFVPVFTLGTMAWSSEATQVQIVPGRVTGPVVVSSGLDFVAMDPHTGTELYRLKMPVPPSGNRRTLEGVVSPVGDQMLVAVSSLSVSDTHGVRADLVQTSTGQTLRTFQENFNFNARTTTFNGRIGLAVVRLFFNGGSAPRLLNTVSGEIGVEINSAQPWFDEPSKRLYGNSGGLVSEYDAVTGALLGQYNMTFAGPVARLPGTDTLIVVGYDHRNEPPYNYDRELRVVVLDMKTMKGRVLRNESSPDWRKYSALGARITPSVTGDTLFFHNITSVAGLFRASHVFAYAKGKGLYLHASALFDTGRSGASGGTPIFLPDLNSFGASGIIGTNGILRMWNLVPVATSAVAGEARTESVTLRVENEIVVLSGPPSSYVVGLYDTQGRENPLRCMATPCRSVDVSGLASGSYLARVDTGTQVVTLPFTIVR